MLKIWHHPHAKVAKVVECISLKIRLTDFKEKKTDQNRERHRL